MEEQQNSGTVSDTIKLKQEVLANGMSVDYVLYRERSGTRVFYSMKISLYDTSESVFIRDITGSPNEAHHIFDLVTHGTVTPCCAIEVIEDLIETL